MTELPIPRLKREDVLLRAFAIMAAGVLFNIGFFFVLGILTPLIVGVIVAYIVGEKWLGPLASALSGLIAFSIILVATRGENEIIVLLEAITIMVVLSFMGGLFGFCIKTKSASS
ncbi:hypothetical protein EU527_00935 [Candidatus Thorarchaeota archaeon]|nr:MAG: hypothetical protein EU527_00935 [Candidatus Thorarchaeota archaeon]